MSRNPYGRAALGGSRRSDARQGRATARRALAAVDVVAQENPTQLKTIAGWRSTPYLLYLINTPKPAAHDREVCVIKPAITQYKENKGRLPLWDQELLGDDGRRLGVVRWGQGIPSGSMYAPHYRCDRKKLGFGKNEEKNTGGCIYVTADRVFTMSKS
ncbi:hypothetical protein [Nonomuraea endophytica]|uniref:Uncharacterized protein n=1 Tax=Nonomuraea endophytica TaxID=714136 RepID=A0A7W8A9T6_9ACTN|nr:hypothetical protein [Nonomuraea endophytica]MBB5082292.1 hypothetical protein [Nonomuraea endophytica]